MKNLKEYISESVVNIEYDIPFESNVDCMVMESFWSKLKKVKAKLTGDEETLALIDAAEKEMDELAKQQKEKEKQMKERIAALEKAKKDEKKLKAERKAQATLISAEYTALVQAQANLKKYLEAAQKSNDKVMSKWKKGKDAVEYLNKLVDKN